MFTEVRQEGTQKRVMLSPTKATISVPAGDNFALATHGVDGVHEDARGDTRNA